MFICNIAIVGIIQWHILNKSTGEIMWNIEIDNYHDYQFMLLIYIYI